MAGLFDGTPLARPVTCERCGKSHAACACPRGRDGKVLNPADQRLTIVLETRRGKALTVVRGLASRSDRTNDLPTILAALKKKLGAGGSIEPAKDQSAQLELQGDHRPAVKAYFEAAGYPATVR